jgi:alanine racemase
MARPTRARVFASALRHNATRVRERAAGSKIMACVKANAYGHGLEWASLRLVDLVDGFAVACIEEALSLRSAGIKTPILLLEGPQNADEVSEAAAQQLTLCVSEAQHLDWLEQRSKPGSLQCWLKIDSGMHRLGFAPAEAETAFARLAAIAAIEPQIVLCTHFAQADLRDTGGCRPQLAVFDAVAGHFSAPQSCANSAAILDAPDSHRAWVRPGYMLYGGSPFADSHPAEFDLEPVMEFSAQVIAIRELPIGAAVGYAGRWRAARPSRIATIAAGYGDGYPRHARRRNPGVDRGAAPAAGGPGVHGYDYRGCHRCPAGSDRITRYSLGQRSRGRRSSDPRGHHRL